MTLLRVIEAAAWIGCAYTSAGLIASLSEDDIWTHHMSGRRDLTTAAMVVALWPAFVGLPALARFGMRNVGRRP